MRRIWITILLPGALILFLIAPSSAGGGSGQRRFRAELTGYEEVLPVSTPAAGEFTARVRNGPRIEYRLSYSNIQNAFAAHIHFGQPGVNGGVVAFLCGGGGKPACPPTGGTVTGTIVSTDIGGPAVQGIAAGEIAEAIAAMRAGVTYVNVHTTTQPPDSVATGPGDLPGGEIRGQLH